MATSSRTGLNVNILSAHSALALSIFLGLLSGCTREKDLLDEQVRKLCVSDGGMRAFEKVVIDSNKLSQILKTRVPLAEDSKSTSEYFYKRETDYIKTGNPSIRRSKWQLIRRSDNKVMGESISYHRVGGDMPGPWNESSFSCPPEVNEVQLLNLVFVRSDQ